MRIAVTGSIATDHLMVFPGAFANQLVAGKLDRISLSFLVDTLDIRWGGVAANISYGLGRLGQSPVLVGAVGTDFADYRNWLRRNGVDTRWVHVSERRHTARFLCTTDDYQNQIASMYTGAMAEAGEIELAPIVAAMGGADLVLVSPNEPAAMVRHTEECRERGYVFAADPSQQLARLSRGEVRMLVEGAKYLFTNEYESELLLSTARWTRQDVLSRVGAWVTTLGEDGVRISSATETVTVPAAAHRGLVDPTGAGDAFRAGFLSGLAGGLAEPSAARLGCQLATLALEASGGQGYDVDVETLGKRVDDSYGTEAAVEITAALPADG